MDEYSLPISCTDAELCTALDMESLHHECFASYAHELGYSTQDVSYEDGILTISLTDFAYKSLHTSERFITLVNSYLTYEYKRELARYNKEKKQYERYCKQNAELIAEYNAHTKCMDKLFSQCKKLAGDLWYKYADFMQEHPKYPPYEPLPAHLFKGAPIYDEYFLTRLQWELERDNQPERPDYPYVHDEPQAPTPLPADAGKKEIYNILRDVNYRQFAEYANAHGFGAEVEYVPASLGTPEGLAIELGDMFISVVED